MLSPDNKQSKYIKRGSIMLGNISRRLSQSFSIQSSQRSSSGDDDASSQKEHRGKLVMLKKGICISKEKKYHTLNGNASPNSNVRRPSRSYIAKEGTRFESIMDATSSTIGVSGRKVTYNTNRGDRKSSVYGSYFDKNEFKWGYAGRKLVGDEASVHAYLVAQEFVYLSDNSSMLEVRGRDKKKNDNRKTQEIIPICRSEADVLAAIEARKQDRMS
jgi:hypothetical protein